MTPNEICHEFARKYEQTYVFIDIPGRDKEELFYLDQVIQTKDPNIGKFRLSSSNLGKIELNLATDHTIRFKYPEVGTFQYGKDAYLFIKVAHRQWTRGLCNRTAAIERVGCILDGGIRNDFDFDRVVHAFEGTKYSFKDALNLLETKKARSVALKGMFSLSLNMFGGIDGYILWYSHYPIAKLSLTGSLETLYVKIFGPTVEEIINGCPIN